jgi:hypothetical protein
VETLLKQDAELIEQVLSNPPPEQTVREQPRRETLNRSALSNGDQPPVVRSLVRESQED